MVSAEAICSSSFLYRSIPRNCSSPKRKIYHSLLLATPVASVISLQSSYQKTCGVVEYQQLTRAKFCL